MCTNIHTCILLRYGFPLIISGIQTASGPCILLEATEGHRRLERGDGGAPGPPMADELRSQQMSPDPSLGCSKVGFHVLDE